MFLDPWLLVPAVTWMLLCYYSKLPRLRAERASRLGLAVPFACCLLGPLSLFPSVAKPQPHQIRAVCQNGMRQIQLAMLNYKSSYGQFPEATEIDTSGKPMHSWRVRLLPFWKSRRFTTNTISLNLGTVRPTKSCWIKCPLVIAVRVAKKRIGPTINWSSDQARCTTEASGHSKEFWTEARIRFR